MMDHDSDGQEKMAVRFSQKAETSLGESEIEYQLKLLLDLLYTLTLTVFDFWI